MGHREENPCKYTVPCRDPSYTPPDTAVGRPAKYQDALPRDVSFSYMPPAYYAKGFYILPAYRKEFDFTEMKKLLFLEDPDQVKKWGKLRARLPYPENRVVDLPGTRELHYKNYCMRRLTPESAMSWRRSIAIPVLDQISKENICRNCRGPDDEKVVCDNVNCPYK